jgi:hypothetical protein
MSHILLDALLEKELCSLMWEVPEFIQLGKDFLGLALQEGRALCWWSNAGPKKLEAVHYYLVSVDGSTLGFVEFECSVLFNKKR